MYFIWMFIAGVVAGMMTTENYKKELKELADNYPIVSDWEKFLAIYVCILGACLLWPIFLLWILMRMK